MIGFKTIDDFSFDECIEYLDSHQDGGEVYQKILYRYNTLLKKVQQNDDDIFMNCRSVSDYEEYLSYFSESEYTHYRPKHKNEAIERINHLKEIQEKERKINKKYNVIGLLLGLVLGFLSIRFLPYILAYLLKEPFRDTKIWLGVFLISYFVLFFIFLILRLIKKKFRYDRIIAFFGGMLLTGTLATSYTAHYQATYGDFSDNGILDPTSTYVWGKGIVDSFGNIIIEPEYSCFYESQNYIIGIRRGSDRAKSIDWYSKQDYKLTKSKRYWFTTVSDTSQSLQKVIESEDGVIINSWKYNYLVIDYCHVNSHDILDLRVSELDNQ